MAGPARPEPTTNGRIGFAFAANGSSSVVQVPAPSAREAHCTVLVCASVSSERPRPCARRGGMGSNACGVVRLDHKLEDLHDEYSRRV